MTFNWSKYGVRHPHRCTSCPAKLDDPEAIMCTKCRWESRHDCFESPTCPLCGTRWLVESHYDECSFSVFQWYDAGCYKFGFRTSREVMGDEWVIKHNETHEIAEGYEKST